MHGYSRVVSALLLRAGATKYFNIIVTEGRPNNIDRFVVFFFFFVNQLPFFLAPDLHFLQEEEERQAHNKSKLARLMSDFPTVHPFVAKELQQIILERAFQ